MIACGVSFGRARADHFGTMSWRAAGRHLRRCRLCMPTLALPEAVAQWSLTSLREKLVKIGAKVVHHARYAVFQMAEVAVPKDLFEKILRLIDGLKPRPAPA
jgi:hypothetical protein